MVSMCVNVGSLLLLGLLALHGFNDVECATRSANRYETYVSSGRTTRHGRSGEERPDTVVHYDIEGSTGGGAVGVTILKTTTSVLDGGNSKSALEVVGDGRKGYSDPTPVPNTGQLDYDKIYNAFSKEFLSGRTLNADYKKCVAAAAHLIYKAYTEIEEYTFSSTFVETFGSYNTYAKTIYDERNTCTFLGLKSVRAETGAGGYTVSATTSSNGSKWMKVVFPLEEREKPRSDRSLGNTKSVKGMRKRMKRNHHLRQDE